MAQISKKKLSNHYPEDSALYRDLAPFFLEIQAKVKKISETKPPLALFRERSNRRRKKIIKYSGKSQDPGLFIFLFVLFFHVFCNISNFDLGVLSYCRHVTYMYRDSFKKDI